MREDGGRKRKARGFEQLDQRYELIFAMLFTMGQKVESFCKRRTDILPPPS